MTAIDSPSVDVSSAVDAATETARQQARPRLGWLAVLGMVGLAIAGALVRLRSQEEV